MVRFDLSNFSRRRRLIAIGSGLVALAAVIGLALALTGGGKKADSAYTTPNVRTAMPPTPSPTFTPALSAVTSTPTPTATLEPYQHVVQPGETLLYIIQLYGYRDLAVIPEILTLNSLANENALQAGQVLLIPRQTPTLGPIVLSTQQGATGEPVVASGGGVDHTGCNAENRCISPDGQYWIHVVQSGETIAGIAFAYSSRVPAILEANDLPNNPLIFEGQEIYVPILVTLTPTLTPTGGPDSTPTPTPTLSPPDLLAPPDQASFPRNRQVVLQWAAVHPLRDAQHYLIVIRNLDTGEEYRFTTRSNAYRLPTDLQPGLGQSLRYEWLVVVVENSSPDSMVLSGQTSGRVFSWGP